MSKGFVHVSHSNHGSVDYYLREGECLCFRDSKSAVKDEVLSNWLAIEKNEKLGNKELGIRGRHDARVRTNYILSMPNSLTAEECLERVQNIIEQTPIAQCHYTMVTHKGEKDGIKNQHVHLLVNERILATQKKDREMQRKVWLDKVFKTLYEKEFKPEFELGATVAPRERITQALFEADRSLARSGIKVHQEQMNTSAKKSKDALVLQQLKSFGKRLASKEERKKSEPVQVPVEEHFIKEPFIEEEQLLKEQEKSAVPAREPREQLEKPKPTIRRRL